MLNTKIESVKSDEYGSILLSLIATLTSCDHMRDVANSVHDALVKLDIAIEWEDFDELRNELLKHSIKYLNVT